MTGKSVDERRLEDVPRLTKCLVSDAEEHAQVFAGLERRFLQLSPGRYEGRASELVLSGTRLCIETHNRAILANGAVGPEVCSVSFVRLPAGHARVDAHALDSQTLGFIPGGYDIEVQSPPDYESVSLHFDKRIFRDAAMVLDESYWSGLSRLRLFQRADLLPLSTLISQVQTAVIAGTGPVALAERTLLSVLLQSMGRAEDRQATSRAMKGRQAALGVVTRARECMEDAGEDVLTILDVCRLTGVSRRTLQASFEKILGTSPSAYLRLRRLSRARWALHHPAAETNVTQVALEQGFWHLGRFARDYRRQFGEYPSQTVKSAKSG